MSNVKETVFCFKTRFKKGFTSTEVTSLLKKFPTVSRKDFDKALGVVTCLVMKGEVVYFHQDVETAINCCIEKRNTTFTEFD